LPEGGLEQIIAKGRDEIERVIDKSLKKVRGTQGTGENEWYTPAEYVELARRATLPRQSLNVDAHAYGAKDEKRQRNCKKDGVPIHVVLQPTVFQKIMRDPQVRAVGGGLPRGPA
jgi:hypothetical protein